jgi:hypothetical protein
MDDCKFGSAECTPLHRCEEERVEFDRVLLAATTENLPIPLLLRFKHCVQIVPSSVCEKYALPQPTEYRVLVTRLLAEKGTQ